MADGTTKLTAQRGVYYQGTVLKKGEEFEARDKDVRWLTGGERAYAKKATAKAAKKEPAADSLKDKTKDELYEIATEREIEGRSSMTKAELIKALEA